MEGVGSSVLSSSYWVRSELSMESQDQRDNLAAAAAIEPMARPVNQLIERVSE